MSGPDDDRGDQAGGGSAGPVDAPSPEPDLLERAGITRTRGPMPVIVVAMLWLAVAAPIIAMARQPAAWPVHAAMLAWGAFVIWFARRPRVTLLAIWLLVAVIGLSAFAWQSLESTVDAVHAESRELRAALGRELTDPDGRIELLRLRAKRGDPLALAELIERFQARERGLARLDGVLRELGADGPYPDGLDPFAPGPTPLRLTWREHSIVVLIAALRDGGDLGRAEAHLAATHEKRERRDRWHRQRVESLESFRRLDGAPPGHQGDHWVAGAGDPAAGFPGEFPWHLLGQGGLDDASYLLREDWARHLDRHGADPLERALVALGSTAGGRARSLLDEVRADAREAGDADRAAVAALWGALARWEDLIGGGGMSGDPVAVDDPGARIGRALLTDSTRTLAEALAQLPGEPTTEAEVRALGSWVSLVLEVRETLAALPPLPTGVRLPHPARDPETRARLIALRARCRAAAEELGARPIPGAGARPDVVLLLEAAALLTAHAQDDDIVVAVDELELIRQRRGQSLRRLTRPIYFGKVKSAPSEPK